jgi:hypothetical protein
VRAFLQVHALAFFVGFSLWVAAAPALGRSPKKGVGMWSFPGDTQALSAVQASWFYTWSPDAEGIAPPGGVSFVPMIWGAAAVTSENLSLVQTEGAVLLGFNEPDLQSQSNLSPQQALGLWPQLVATGMRLGSPAPAYGAATDGGWLETFMKGAADQDLPVDFICLHWYGGDFDTGPAVSELQDYLEQTHAAYGLPIWLTEFALTNYTDGVVYPTVEQQAAFATAAVEMLEATPYVERYAWFSLPPCPAGGGNGGCGTGNTTPLSSDGGALTPVGDAYALAQAVDAGVPADAGLPDAGSLIDGGTSPDAGASTDAGLLTDAGLPPDAGVAGPDAGDADAGTGEVIKPKSGGCSSAGGESGCLGLCAVLAFILGRRSATERRRRA